jgi:hypothetical protein
MARRLPARGFLRAKPDISEAVIKAFVPPPWRLGKVRGSLIGPSSAFSSPDEIKRWGGALVAEHVLPGNVPLILEAPSMFACLKDMQTWGMYRGIYGAAQRTIIAEAERILIAIEGDRP